jgi:hypothetical protein
LVYWNIPTAVKEPHNANNHIGSLLPLPLEGRIDKSTETGGPPSSKEGNDIGPSLCVIYKREVELFGEGYRYRIAGGWSIVGRGMKGGDEEVVVTR